MESKEKPTAERWFSALLLLLFITGSFLFFQVNYRYWYHFMEQYAMFRTTSSYFTDLVAQPGGFNAYLSEFFMQLFYYPGGAALLIALLLGSVAFLFHKFLQKTGLQVSIVIAILPLLLFWLYPVETVTPLTALFFALLSANIYASTKKKGFRYILGLLLIIVNYLLAAPAHLELAALMVVYELLRGEREKWGISLTWLAGAILLPVVAMQMLYVIPVREAWVGKHLYHPEYPIPFSFWVIWGVFPLLTLLLYGLRKKHSPLGKKLKTALPLVFLLLFMLGGIVLGGHPMEQAYRYDYYARQNRWQEIVEDARQHGIEDKDALIYTNLALSKTGQLEEQFLHFPQTGREGLIPHDPKSRLGLIEAAEVAWHLNHINSAQRFAFVGVLSSQRCVQPRLMQRLVETYLVNEEFRAAAKYIAILETVPLYRAWAADKRPLLHPATASETPWISEKRAFRSVTDNPLDLTVNFAGALAYMLDDHPDNPAAFAYAMTYLLIEKDLETLMHYMEQLRDMGKPFPRTYQEAICIVYSTRRTDPAAFRSFPIEPQVYKRFRTFTRDVRSLSPVLLKERYGDSYFYYAQFVSSPNQKKR